MATKTLDSTTKREEPTSELRIESTAHIPANRGGSRVHEYSGGQDAAPLSPQLLCHGQQDDDQRRARQLTARPDQRAEEE